MRASSGTNGSFRFTGEQSDAETGFTYLRARYLDPAIGRFGSVDTVQPNAAGTQGWNVYAYAGGNPVRWMDPSGHNLAETSEQNGASKKPAGALVILGRLIEATFDALLCAFDPVCHRVASTISTLISEPHWPPCLSICARPGGPETDGGEGGGGSSGSSTSSNPTQPPGSSSTNPNDNTNPRGDPQSGPGLKPTQGPTSTPGPDRCDVMNGSAPPIIQNPGTYLWGLKHILDRHAHGAGKGASEFAAGQDSLASLQVLILLAMSRARWHESGGARCEIIGDLSPHVVGWDRASKADTGLVTVVAFRPPDIRGVLTMYPGLP